LDCRLGDIGKGVCAYRTRMTIRALDHAAVGNHNLLLCFAALTAQGLNLLNELHVLNDLTEYDVLAIEPCGDDGGDKELRSISVRASVRHGQ